MNNNVFTTTTELSRTIGATTEFDTATKVSSLSRVSGELSLGMLVFDEAGTMGICTNVNTENATTSYTIMTATLNTEIDVLHILSQGY